MKHKPYYPPAYSTCLARILRKAKEHGASLTTAQLDRAAFSTALHIDQQPYRYYTFSGTDNLPGRMTVREYMAHYEAESTHWFGGNEEDTLSRYRGNSYWDEDVYIHIPDACQGYDPDSVAVANWRYIHSEYDDLFKFGLLVDEGSCVAILLDKPYYNEDRLDTLMEEIATVRNGDGVFDDQELSDVERERQEATVKGEVERFIRHLSLPDHIEAKLFPDKNDKYGRMGKFDWDNALLSESDVEAHIWQLIRKHEIDVDDDQSIDIEEVAKLSPLYQLGEEKSTGLWEMIGKLQTSQSYRPDLSPLLSQVVADLQLLDNTKPIRDGVAYFNS